ncbi:hypothetical protein HMPREF9445_02295 [Bacteroides clarus YIT 12056]|uniref:Uncharacterized protein n=1 Tax=Bacteroides clarus YIT 12056 TaxID=762984 RepID=A0ABP2KRX8_9BACE|nr:hypothetical protein HMPREF9445_02295 [Bacteroides clarus YIT 12056]
MVLWEEFGFQSSAKLPYFQFINIGLHLPRPCLWEIAGEACFFTSQRLKKPQLRIRTLPYRQIRSAGQKYPSRETKKIIL